LPIEMDAMTESGRVIKGKPHWIRRRLPSGPEYEQVRALIKNSRLHTVCQEAACPNQYECFSKRTATFLIMGSRCTRNCRFCNIESGTSMPALDPGEPARVAEAIVQMNLRYAVITSVTRDDLPDGGAGHFAATILEIRKRLADTRIEVLIPDFQGDATALQTVLQARPHVLNHNVETVPRLYPQVRPQADYGRSLNLLEATSRHRPALPVKSGLMLGLGETLQEVHQTLKDLFLSGCRFLTIGQYLQPSEKHLPVQRFVTPEEFEQLGDLARVIGFEQIASGPFVRSSYHAYEMYCGHPKTGCPDSENLPLRSPGG
jgi:lipoic acid synthetase